MKSFVNDVIAKHDYSCCADQSQNDSFQNQEEQACTSGLPLRRRKQSPPIWEPLMKKKSPNPKSRSAAVIASNALG